MCSPSPLNPCRKSQSTGSLHTGHLVDAVRKRSISRLWIEAFISEKSGAELDEEGELAAWLGTELVVEERGVDDVDEDDNRSGRNISLIDVCLPLTLVLGFLKRH